MNGKRFIKKSLGAGLTFMICMNMAMSVCAQNLNNDTRINVVNEQESTVNETTTEEMNQSDENSIEAPMDNLTSDNEELEAPELSMWIPDMEISEADGGELGIVLNGECYDGDNPQYPLDYLREQGTYEGVFDESDGEGRATAINSTKVDLYVLDDDYKDKLTIPSNYKQSYQLSVTDGGKATYSIYEGNSVTVSSAGLIQPATTTWYWNGNIGSTVSSGSPNETVDISYNYGKSIVKVVTSANTYYVTVTVNDYARYYAEKVMDTFLAKNVTAGMSDYEKLKKIAAFPCNYDYSPYYSGYVGMIIYGGGDCWASSSAILYLCEKAGLQAHLRYGVNDSGAGSGHRNVAVKLGDRVYVVDAGYDGDAPRFYSIDEENTGFYYYINNDKLSIMQYDGFDSDITVPSQIDGYEVTTLGENAFVYGERYSEVPINAVVLPETLQTIGNGAFNSCQSLETITIPASVNQIGDFVFTSCKSLKEINAKTENSQYASRDGVLYNKSLNDLLYYPAGKKGAYTVPSSVKTIHEYAFYYTSGIHTIILPKSVESVGVGAFAESAIMKLYFQGNAPDFGTYAFRYLDFQVLYPKGNTTWNETIKNDYGANNVTWNAWNSISNFRAASAGKNKVRLTWSGLENVDGYLVYAQKDGKYGYVSMTTNGGTTLTDKKALDHDYNFYWVFPYILDEGEIVVVPGMSSKYVYAKGICPAVTNLKPSSTSKGVKLTWTGSPDAEGYLIYGIRGDNGKYGYIGMTTKGTTFTDTKAYKTQYNFYWVFPYHTDSNGKMIVGGTPKYVYGRAK